MITPRAQNLTPLRTTPVAQTAFSPPVVTVEWHVSSTVAGWVIRTMTDNNIPAKYSVDIQYPPKPAPGVVTDQVWIVSGGSADDVDAAVQELTDMQVHITNQNRASGRM